MLQVRERKKGHKYCKGGDKDDYFLEMKLLNYCIPGKPKRIAGTNLETANKDVCRNLVWEGFLKGFFK